MYGNLSHHFFQTIFVCPENRFDLPFLIYANIPNHRFSIDFCRIQPFVHVIRGGPDCSWWWECTLGEDCCLRAVMQIQWEKKAGLYSFRKRAKHLEYMSCLALTAVIHVLPAHLESVRRGLRVYTREYVELRRSGTSYVCVYWSGLAILT